MPADLDLQLTATPAHRRRPKHTRPDTVTEALVSYRTGIVHTMEQSRHPIVRRRLFLFSAAAGDPIGISGGQWMFAGGIAADREHAAIAALAEGFERHVWSRRSGRPVMLTREEIEERALRPTEFVRQSASETATADRFGHAPFDPTAHPYLPGHDLYSGQDRWVLAGTILPAYEHPDGHGYVCDRASTGMAVGSDSAMALIGGAAELIERDAFTITYLNRLPLPEIDLGTVADPRLQAMLAAAMDRPGVRVRAWDMTLDIRVPTVLCAFSVDVDGEPAVRFGSATHPSARTAMWKAFAEATKIASLIRADGVRRNRREAPAVTPATHLRGPDDHAALGDLREYLSTLDWLLNPRTGLKRFPEVEAIGCPPQAPTGAGSTDTLTWLVRRLAASDLRAYGIDLTPPEAKEATGLEAWRVVIPGCQPLTFGGRCVGLDSERLRFAPVRAGFRAAPLADDEFSPLPHPFS